MSDATNDAEDITEERLWRKNGWIGKVVKNEDDDGWAVEMTRIGDAEPVLVCPWTMGRDKKNPKPLNDRDFATLTKTAKEVLLRSEQHAYAQAHQSRTVFEDGKRFLVKLDLVPDEDDPHSLLTCVDEATDSVLATRRVPPTFKLTAASADEFAKNAARQDQDISR
jgi:hypothetical protein